MSERHRLKIHKWVSGILDITETWHDNFADALRVCHQLINEGHHVKIYDENGGIMHDSKPIPIHGIYASYA